MKMYNVKAKVIPNGVDLEVFKPCKRERSSERYPVIINVTAYNKFKGKDSLLKYFKVLQKSI
jgi:glycosyltransferase involved in cell wall biosynthesis